MFYIFAPALGHIFVIPVQKFNWANFFASNAFWAQAYRGLIWVCYFIPLLYVLNVIFTFITYLCINNEIVHETNTFTYIKIAIMNSLKVFAVQLPIMAIFCFIVSLFGVTKTIFILMPFSTEVIRAIIFALWLITLIIIQMSLALKVNLKPSLGYALCLLKEYKLIWFIYTWLIVLVSFILLKGTLYLFPNFTANGVFSNLYLTGFTLAIYIVIVVFLLHHLFAFEKPFELED